jgi:hypothetical protein
MTSLISCFFRLGLLVCILVAYVYQVERVHPVYFFGQFQDDSIYFSTAKALANGQSYTLISFPGSPPETKYPIVYPWLLSFVWKMNPNFPGNLIPAIHLTEFFGGWSLLAGFFLLRRLPGVGDPAGLCLTAVLAIQPVFVRASGLVMSDIPFMACMLTVLALCVYACETQRGAGVYALIGLLAGVSVGIRTVGIALVLGVCCTFLLKRSFRPAVIIMAAAALAIVLVTVPASHSGEAGLGFGDPSEPGWNQVAAYYTSYSQFQWGMGVPSLAAFGQMVLLNLFAIAASPGPILVGAFGGAFGKAVFFASMLLAVPLWIGLGRKSRNSDWRVVIFTMFFYCCVILVWPYPQPERFLLPFLPVLLAGLWCELRRIGTLAITKVREPGAPSQRFFPLTVPATAAAIFFFFLLALGVWNSVVVDPRARRAGSASLAATLTQREQAYQWIREHTEPGERVGAWQDAVLYLYTGRQSLRPVAILPQAIYHYDQASLEKDLAHICDAPRHAQVRYWLTAPDDFRLESHRKELAARMAQVAGVLPMVYRSQDGSVQILNADCLNRLFTPECRKALPVLFPQLAALPK